MLLFLLQLLSRRRLLRRSFREHRCDTMVLCWWSVTLTDCNISVTLRVPERVLSEHCQTRSALDLCGLEHPRGIRSSESHAQEALGPFE